MSFFDDKQDILKVELTTYGRFLLSRGKFKPAYYAFFDDDVLYDGEYGGIEETQNNVQVRILDETPSLKPQSSFIGIDKKTRENILVQTEDMGTKTEAQQNSTEKNYALSAPLANCSLGSLYSPSWSLNFMSGTISSTEPHIDNSVTVLDTLTPFEKIPQINLKDLIFDIKKTTNDFTPIDGYNNIFNSTDGTNTYTYYMNESEILVDVSELNVDDLNENFDIEIFIEEKEYLNNNQIKTNLKKLNFVKPKVEILNGVLLDEPLTYSDNVNETYAEYFFDITVDQEIELPPAVTPNIITYGGFAARKPPYGDNC